MSTAKFISEARARILWGESSLSVRDFLISNGVSEIETDARIREFSLERNTEIRRLGMKSTFVGLAFLAGAGIMAWVIAGLIRDGYLYIGPAAYYAVLSVAGLYGIWRLVKGIIYLIRPQSEHKSIPDMSG